MNSILIANRGEIACRIIHTCQRLGIRTVAVYSAADRDARHVQLADSAVYIGPAPPAESYLNVERIIDAARRTGATAVHPGYGFGAENAAFAHACIDAGLLWIGPTPHVIATMGNKRAAKQIAQSVNVPIVPGYNGADQADATLRHAAERIGYPLMVKAAAGGGGKGMRLIHSAAELDDALAGARREARSAFGSDDLMLERAIIAPRHIEVQVFGDVHGNVVHLGERECSIQRRHQKIIEESPSPTIDVDLRQRMHAAAVAIARAIDYTNAGTVEFIVDRDDQFYFLEMNTRLQVEHPVTEMVTGHDLVAWQIAVAEGAPLPLEQNAIQFVGHAIEARVYAEDPANGFLPVTGDVLLWREPSGDGVRVDSGIRSGDAIGIHYDPLIAKISAHGPNRATALRRLARALDTTKLLGLQTNLDFLRRLVLHPQHVAANLSTAFIAEHMHADAPSVAEVDLYTALVAAALAQSTQHGSHGGYWRNNPNSGQRYRFNYENTIVELELTPDRWHVQQWTAALNGAEPRSVILHSYADHDLTLTIDGVQRTMTLAQHGDGWWLDTPSGGLRLRSISLLPQPQPSADAGGSLRAPMPGAVVAVLVEPGQHVHAGQALLKLEAMKMEHTIRSAAAGVVEEIYYRAGDAVEADAVLVSIKELD